MDHKADEKYGLLVNESVEVQDAPDSEYYSIPSSHRQSYQGSLTIRRLAYYVIPSCALLLLLRASYSSFFRPSCTYRVEADEHFLQSIAANDSLRVPLEAHIMSKCPDSKDCLRDLVVPAMEEVYDKVDFKLSYIGTIDSDDGVTCRHGQSECLGNILELCAADLYSDPKIYLGFTMCMTQKYEDIPSRDLAHDCALEHGVDFDKLNDCVSEEGKGMDLLEASVQRSIDKGVKYSCTVRLNETVRCIRDGGEWKDCDGGSSVQDLVKDVENMYKANYMRGV